MIIQITITEPHQLIKIDNFNLSFVQAYPFHGYLDTNIEDVSMKEDIVKNFKLGKKYILKYVFEEVPE